MQKYIITMARKIPSNLEELSQSNELNVTVFANAKYTRFTHIFKIPLKN